MTAIAEAKEHLRAGYRTVVDLDLAQFFDRVHHQRLLDRIGQRVADRRVVALVRLMLKAAVAMPDGTRIIVREGTPQGGPLSPLLSNPLVAETKVRNEPPIPFQIRTLQVLEEAAAASDHLQEAAATVMIFLMLVEVAPKLIDPGRQEGNLDRSAPTIFFVELVFLDDFFAINRHFS